jgi:hypothetical protein
VNARVAMHFNSEVLLADSKSERCGHSRGIEASGHSSQLKRHQMVIWGVYVPVVLSLNSIVSGERPPWLSGELFASFDHSRPLDFSSLRAFRTQRCNDLGSRNAHISIAEPGASNPRFLQQLYIGLPTMMSRESPASPFAPVAEDFHRPRSSAESVAQKTCFQFRPGVACIAPWPVRWSTDQGRVASQLHFLFWWNAEDGLSCPETYSHRAWPRSPRRIWRSIQNLGNLVTILNRSR